MTHLHRMRSWVLRRSACALLLIGAVYLFDKVLPGLLAEDLAVADRLVVRKADRVLLAMRQGQVLKSYPVSLGGQPIGAKRFEGDGRTPEGLYVIDWRNERSRFHLSLHISYPDSSDRARAAAAGLPPGGDIMIHGRPNWLSWLGPWFAGRDWTDGCIAVGNVDMEELLRAVPIGTPIEIQP